MKDDHITIIFTSISPGRSEVCQACYWTESLLLRSIAVFGCAGVWTTPSKYICEVCHRHYYSDHCRLHRRHHRLNHPDLFWLIDHRTGGKLSSGSIILKSLASSLDVAAVKFNLNVSRCQNNQEREEKISPERPGGHRKQTGASPSRGWRWGWSPATSQGRLRRRLLRMAQPPPGSLGVSLVVFSRKKWNENKWSAA